MTESSTVAMVWGARPNAGQEESDSPPFLLSCENTFSTMLRR